jgi:decaprenylphospho-beta-D-erythro-pentofuranosid-2-ulose 2-reductase
VVNDAFGHPQSVVVLGGTSDIGRAIVGRLVGLRCRTVVLAARDPARLAAAADEAAAAGATAVATVHLDATEPGSARDTVAEAFKAAGGPVDMVLVTVGLLGEPERDERDPDRVGELVTVNFTWPAVAMAEAVERLRAQGSGRLVVLSTVAGVRVRRANFLYGSAKAGLDAMTWGWSEVLRDAPDAAVAVQLVRPGFVHSKMTTGLRPAPFATTPDAVADAVVRGIERGESVTWVPGVLRWAFAVLRLLPPSLWRRLPG